MKKIILLVVVAIFLNAKAIILTSPPNYQTMKLITADSMWQTIPTFDGSKYVIFTKAYKRFYNNVQNEIEKNVKKYKLKGVVNFRINCTATKDWYHFWATYDYFK